MRWILGFFLAAAVAGPALADSCYVRDYSPEHLRKNPDQVVARMQIRFIEGEDRYADVKVRFRDSDRLFSQGMNCYDDNGEIYKDGVLSCSVDCDGGTFVMRPRGDDAVLISTPWGFIVSGGCGEEDEDIRNVLDRGAESTTFKLYRKELQACE